MKYKQFLNYLDNFVETFTINLLLNDSKIDITNDIINPVPSKMKAEITIL